MVTPNDVSKFQRAYRRRFGVELDPFVAREKLELLVRQMEVVYGPIHTQEVQVMNVDEDSNDKEHSLTSK